MNGTVRVGARALRIRQFGTCHDIHRRIPKYSSDDISVLGLVPVPGVVLEIHAADDEPRLAEYQSVETLLRPSSEVGWLNEYASSILIEWRSDISLHGVAAEFEAHDLKELAVRDGALACKRAIERFATDVTHLASVDFAVIDDHYLIASDCKRDRELPDGTLQALMEQYSDYYRRCICEPFPTTVSDQVLRILQLIIERWSEMSVEDSWLSITLRQMVSRFAVGFEGSGHLFTCNPENGKHELHVVFSATDSLHELDAGVANVRQSPEREIAIRAWAQSLSLPCTPPMQIGFVILNSRILIDYLVPLELTPHARISVAAAGVNGKNDLWQQSLQSVLVQDVASQFVPQLRNTSVLLRLADGFGASPGAAVGVLCCDPTRARSFRNEGLPVILAATSPGPQHASAIFDVDGLIFATGGATSHISVIARGMGIPCVVGINQLQVSDQMQQVIFGSTCVHEGEWITVDGNTGVVHLGKAVLTLPDDAEGGDVRRLLDACDQLSQLDVYANADVVAEAETAYRLGAQGIGLCRLEHMMLRPNRLSVLQRVIVLALACGDLAENVYLASERCAQFPESCGAKELLREAEQRAEKSIEYQSYISELRNIETCLTEDLTPILETSQGRSAVIRLFDPPLSEFLTTDCIEEVQRTFTLRSTVILPVINLLNEPNPMLGMRGIRLCLRAPEFARAQVRAIFRAACLARHSGSLTQVDIMAPFVVDPHEITLLKEIALSVMSNIGMEMANVTYRVGAMIETPRAALMADRLARTAQFLSFGTNDLTQFVWACSRDSADNALIARGAYRSHALTPFSEFDHDGVGLLMRNAVQLAREVAPSLSIGVCGEYASDSKAIEFFSHIGIDYLSCSPLRIPATRLLAAQASVRGKTP